MTTNDNVAAQYIENEVINVSIVLNTNNKQMLIYLNGILSGMAGYTWQQFLLVLNSNMHYIQKNI